jgi:hypothetical protein
VARAARGAGVRRTREVTVDARPEHAWRALSAGAWGGPIRLAVGPAAYAGTVTVVDVDEDDRSVGCHVQARSGEGWAGVAAVLELRPAAAGGGVVIEGDVEVVGQADERTADALLDELAERVRRALADAPAPRRSPAVASPETAPSSPADDPAWRRRLAVRAAAAVAVGAAAGLALARRGSGR